MLNLVKNLTTLRGEDTFIIGEYTPVIVDENIFSFVREFDGKKGLVSPHMCTLLIVQGIWNNHPSSIGNKYNLGLLNVTTSRVNVILEDGYWM